MAKKDIQSITAYHLPQTPHTSLRTLPASSDCIIPTWVEAEIVIVI